MRAIFLSFVLAIFGSAAQAAENLALIIANKDYRNFSDARDAFEATDLNAALVDGGFDVRVIRNMSRRAMEQLAPVIRREIDGADRVMVFVSGHVFSTSRESWFMATDAPRQDGLLAGAYGLPISAVIDLMGGKAGRAVLLVGDSGNAQRLGGGLRYGYIPNDIAQGVTVFAGRTGALADLVTDGLLLAGTSTLDAAEAAPRGVSAFGFLSRSVAFLPKAAVAEDTGGQVDELEQLIWDNAQAAGTAASVTAYLDRYPDGYFAAQAGEMLADLQKPPLELAKDAEIALNLSRQDRRDIQRNLSLLDYDTRGVDGIFGPGTRAAIRGWQRDSDFADMGYLTGNQIVALENAAVRRAAVLEEEARERRLEQDRQDAEYWRSTGRGNTEDGLRDYIKKYPDGLYSDIALDRIANFDAERRRQAQAEEAKAWDEALARNSEAEYAGFLNRFPNGVFAQDARDRLAAIQASQVNDAVIAEERNVMSNPVSRILVEQKLAALGFKPGRVDGRIDDKTRKAVRQFQRAADLPVSGYVTQATIVRLLAAR